MTECLEKVAYLSEFVANNAAELHRMSHPGCVEIDAYACGDHWHIGHHDRAAGEWCKATNVNTRPRWQGAS